MIYTRHILAQGGMPMAKTLIYPIGKSRSCYYCTKLLKAAGLSLIDHPSPEVTHLLLDIPSKPCIELDQILSMLPPTTQVIGGNLNLTENPSWDLLQDENYLTQNAAITAHCAIKVALPCLDTTISDTPTLIIGWGRIGKCLAQLLRSMNCPVTVAARNQSQRAMLSALGYPVQDAGNLNLKGFRLLFNTAPEPILSEQELSPYPNLTKIDLASYPGLTGKDVIFARGLPGIHAPESSGKLQAKTILCYLKEDHS